MLARLRRPPDFVIGPRTNPYMLRWYLLPRNRWGNVYLHKICRSDDDRALHDHPWPSLSLMLAGALVEVTPRGSCRFAAGDVVFRGPHYAHRLIVPVGKPVWTLFLTGPRVREWGFHCPKGWVPWQQFVAGDDHGNIGRGCGEAV